MARRPSALRPQCLIARGFDRTGDRFGDDRAVGLVEAGELDGFEPHAFVEGQAADPSAATPRRVNHGDGT